MDAISFNVGLRSNELRGKQLKDLVYRSSADDGHRMLLWPSAVLGFHYFPHICNARAATDGERVFSRQVH
jgi:hypothetical protein